jgi:hypothetical protein
MLAYEHFQTYVLNFKDWILSTKNLKSSINCNLNILIIWKLEIRKGFQTWIMYLMDRKEFYFLQKYWHCLNGLHACQAKNPQSNERLHIFLVCQVLDDA